MPNYLKPLQRCSDGRCGASDCPKCARGCDDIVTCAVCGEEEYVCYAAERGWADVDTYNLTGYCPDCEAEAGE